jgi:hypothetical protein
VIRSQSAPKAPPSSACWICRSRSTSSSVGAACASRRLLTLGPGSVLELDVAAGTPLSILANRVVIAHGEAVVVGERYGVRVTEIVSQKERVRGLGALGGGGT